MVARTKPEPVFCGNYELHEPHKFGQSKQSCVGYVSPIREEKDTPITKSPDDVSDLNRLWISIAPLRLELAKLAKDGMEKYPVGEIILIMRRILREEVE